MRGTCTIRRTRSQVYLLNFSRASSSATKMRRLTEHSDHVSAELKRYLSMAVQANSESIVGQHEVPPCHSELRCPPGVGPCARSPKDRRTGNRWLHPEPIGHCVLHDVLWVRFACVRHLCVWLHGGHKPAGIRLDARSRRGGCLWSLLRTDWVGGPVLTCVHWTVPQRRGESDGLVSPFR